MHYNYFYGEYDKILPISRQVVESHAEEWKESSDPAKDDTTRLLQLCGMFGREAYWIVITDMFYNIIGTVTIGEKPTYYHMYNFLVTPTWRKTGFGTKLIELIKPLCENKPVVGFVKEENAPLIAMYKRHGAKETLLVPEKKGYIALGLPVRPQP